MIIYIHGFGGSGQGTKAKILRELLKEKGFIAPSLSYVPQLAINTLKELISTFSKYEKVYLIGSSLGGYYATYLADYFNIQAILLNPSVNPTKTLRNCTQDAPNFFDNSSFKWSENHVEMLKEYEISSVKSELYMLMAQKGDELLDYKEAGNKFKDSKQIIQDGGNHGFDGIEDMIEDMIGFFDIEEKYQEPTKEEKLEAFYKFAAIANGEFGNLTVQDIKVMMGEEKLKRIKS